MNFYWRTKIVWNIFTLLIKWLLFQLKKKIVIEFRFVSLQLLFTMFIIRCICMVWHSKSQTWAPLNSWKPAKRLIQMLNISQLPRILWRCQVVVLWKFVSVQQIPAIGCFAVTSTFAYSPAWLSYSKWANAVKWNHRQPIFQSVGTFWRRSSRNRKIKNDIGKSTQNRMIKKWNYFLIGTWFKSSIL